jgi:hypothetical protein
LVVPSGAGLAARCTRGLPTGMKCSTDELHP